MNKTLALVLLLATAMFIVCIPNEYTDADVANNSITVIKLGDFTYEIIDSTNNLVAIHEVNRDDIENMTIPDTITYGDNEYRVVSLKGLNERNTDDVKTLYIGKYVSEITDVPKPEKVFPEMFDSLETISVDPENTTFTAIDGVLFKGTTLYLFPKDYINPTYTVPASTTDIIRGSFAYADNLTTLKVADGNQAFSADSNGMLYNKDKSTLFAYPAEKKDPRPVIPDTVKRLEMYAFAGSEIERITIPDSANDFGNFVFKESSELKEIVLGKNVTKIDTEFFNGCSSLEDIVITANINSMEIEPFAFKDCDSDLEFESGRDGYDLDVYYDEGFTREYNFSLNAEDITLYLKWTKDTGPGDIFDDDDDGNNGMSMMLIGIVIGIVIVVALLGFLYMRKSS